MVIVTHNKHRRPKTLTKHPKIIRRRHRRKITRKRNHLNTIYTSSRKQLLLLLQRRQKTQITRILLKHGTRMRPERNNHGLLSPFTGRRDHGIQKVTVPKMDTVKKACCNYSHLGLQPFYKTEVLPVRKHRILGKVPCSHLIHAGTLRQYGSLILGNAILA